METEAPSALGTVERYPHPHGNLYIEMQAELVKDTGATCCQPEAFRRDLMMNWYLTRGRLWSSYTDSLWCADPCPAAFLAYPGR